MNSSENKYLVVGIASIVIIIGVYLFINRDRFFPKSLMNGNLASGENTTPSPVVSPNPISGRPQVTLTTSKGAITIELRPDVAPKTVANFIEKWNSGYCTGKTFHRVEDWVVQGCDPKGDGTGGGDTLPTETSSESFLVGAVGVARKQFPKEVSNDSQFFIVKKDATFLNGEYTYFGRVVSGMDVVNKLSVGDKIGETIVLSK
jgi:cyclophilin family peptidyl-prolyl cis-trans isomerase